MSNCAHQPPLALVTSLAVALAALVIGGCGDDFERQEADGLAADTAPSDTLGGDANGDAASDVGSTLDADQTDTSTDTSGADAGDSGAGDTIGSTPFPCKQDADCAKAPACFVSRCLEAKSKDGSAGKFCAQVQVADETPCDDGDICTAATTCTTGVCGTDLPSSCNCKGDEDCYAYDDEDYCNGFYTCDTSAATPHCVLDPATVVVCDKSDDVCKPNLCYESVGACKPGPAQDGQPCDDNEACLTDDVCVGGKCEGQQSVCPCQSNADCAAIDNSDPCDGTLFCDTSAFPSECKTSPASLIDCPTTNDSACATNKCNPKVAKCQMIPVKDGFACQDGDSCTEGDACYDGDCVPGEQTCPCAKTSDCAKFEDGDACNGTLYCDFSLKKPGCSVNPATLVTCDPPTDQCLTNTCNKQSAACEVAPIKDNTLCDDNNPCTAGDHCKAGKCTQSANVCSCTTDADCKDKSTDACRGPMFCNVSAAPFVCAFNPAKEVVCDASDDSACAVNTCDKADGKCKSVAQPEGKTCDADNNPCTKGDVCAAGKCTVGKNVCQCQSNGDCGKFEDGNACNGTMFCDKSKLPLLCEVNPATVVTCPTVGNTECRAIRCDKKDGGCKVQSINNGGTCDADGSPCTKDDTCSGGDCQVGTNTCGCQTDADCVKQEDGDPCNGTLYCDGPAGAKACKINPATVVKCDASANTACKANLCAKTDGKCAWADRPNGTKCEDGIPCTAGETCLAGKCTLYKGAVDVCGCKNDAFCAEKFPQPDKCAAIVYCNTSKPVWSCEELPFSAVECPDANLPCAELKCQPKTGVCEPIADQKPGTPCDDADPCTQKSACEGPVCKGKPDADCDDKNPCTVDSCKPSKGCEHYSLSNITCDDHDKCTSNDTCDGGVCLGQAVTPCTASS